MSEGKTIWEDVFGTPEDQVETFLDVIKDKGGVVDPEASDFSRIVNGVADRIEAPNLVDQTSGFVRIQHGWHGKDYVWHISPIKSRRSWRVSVDRVIYATAKMMSGSIPDDIEVKIWKPYLEWEVKEITFKAIGLKDRWAFSQSVMDKMHLKLFEVLNTLL